MHCYCYYYWWSVSALIVSQPEDVYDEVVLIDGSCGLWCHLSIWLLGFFWWLFLKVWLTFVGEAAEALFALDVPESNCLIMWSWQKKCPIHGHRETRHQVPEGHIHNDHIGRWSRPNPHSFWDVYQTGVQLEKQGVATTSCLISNWLTGTVSRFKIKHDYEEEH